MQRDKENISGIGKGFGLSGIMRILFVFSVFSICVCGGILLQPQYCPDEAGRQLLSTYIYQNGCLPTGNERETMLQGWGFSYALRPYLSAIVSAFFMKLASFFSPSERVMLLMSRMGSILSITGFSYFCLKIGDSIFQYARTALLFAFIACFFPQVLFLGMYQNNDSFALLGVSILLYYLLKGYNKHWRIRDCLGFAMGCSICILAYYSVYPWVLTGGIIFVVACLFSHKAENPFCFWIQRVCLVAGTVFFLTGWFFVRNAMYHNGDFLGLASEAVSRLAMEDQGMVLYPYHSMFAEGYSFPGFLAAKDYEWIRWTVRSLIGYFGHMYYPLPAIQYKVYYACILLAFFLFVCTYRRAEKSILLKVFMLNLLISNIIVIGLSLYQSYYRDYEPQGRYVITLVLLIAFVFAFGTEQAGMQNGVGKDDQGKKIRLFWVLPFFYMLIWVGLFAWAWFGTMSKTFFEFSKFS